MSSVPSAVAPSSPTVDSNSRNRSPIFFGPNGLRAGWSLAIFILIVATLVTAIHFAVPAIRHHFNPQAAAAVAAAKQAAPNQVKLDSPVNDLLQEVLLLTIVCLATWIMSRIEKRPIGEYGLGGNARRWPQLFQGLLWGFAMLSLLIGGLYLAHDIVFDGRLLHSFAIFGYAAVWLLFFGMVGLFEEFLFRGYIQFTLARGIGFGGAGFWLSALAWNFLFGFGHSSNTGESLIGLFSAGAIGFTFCLSLWYTRSLWWAIGFHTAWDWAQSYFYGTPDSGLIMQGHLYGTHPHGAILSSGGATGPEGSWMVIPVDLLTIAIIWLTLRHERSKSTNQALVNPLSNPLPKSTVNV